MSQTTALRRIEKCIKENFPAITPSKRGVIFEIGASWCSSCRKFEEFYKSPEGQKKLDLYLVQKVDYDNDKLMLKCLAEEGYIKESKVMLPLFLLFSSRGSFVDRLTSFGNGNKFISELRKAYSKGKNANR